MQKNLFLGLAGFGFCVATSFAQFGACPPPTPSFTPTGAATPAPTFTPSGGATPTPVPPKGGATPGNGNGGTTGAAGAGGVSGGAGNGGGASPTRPGYGAAPGGAPAAGSTGGTTGARKKSSNSMESAVDWEWWWLYNGARYLNLKAVLRTNGVESQDDTTLRGEDTNSEAARVSDAIRSEIAPMLEKALTDGASQVRAETLLALGKCGSTAQVDDIVKLLADKDLDVRESACLSLGILGDASAVATLVEVMNNTAAGKKAIGKDSDVMSSTRAYAAMAIGLIGSRSSLDTTNAITALESLLSQKVANNDLHVAAVVAMGLTRSTDAVPALVAIIKNVEADDIVRSYALTALGKIGDRSSVSVAVGALKDKSQHVRRSAALALGVLGAAEDATIIDSLAKTANDGADRAERNFAIMALGQIGGAKAREALVDLVKSTDPHEKTFGALALGIACQNANAQEREAAGTLIHEQFRENKTCRVRGALAVAMGLMGYKKAAAELIEVVDSNAHGHLRGECAQALGLMRHTEAIPVLKKTIEETNETGVRTSVAVALGLIADKEAIDILNKVMKDNGGNVAVSGAILRGLGLIGDRTVVKGLGAVLSAKDQQDAVRAYAAEALGLLGDKDDFPTLTRISENNNYVSQSGTLMSVLNRML